MSLNARKKRKREIKMLQKKNHFKNNRNKELCELNFDYLKITFPFVLYTYRNKVYINIRKLLMVRVYKPTNLEWKVKNIWSSIKHTHTSKHANWTVSRRKNAHNHSHFPIKEFRTRVFLLFYVSSCVRSQSHTHTHLITKYIYTGRRRFHWCARAGTNTPRIFIPNTRKR